MNNENILELKKQVHALEGALFELASPFRYNIPVEVFGEVLERHGVKGHEFGPGVRKPEPQQELMDLKKQAHALEGALFEFAGRYEIPVETFGEVMQRHGVKGHEVMVLREKQTVAAAAHELVIALVSPNNDVLDEKTAKFNAQHHNDITVNRRPGNYYEIETRSKFGNKVRDMADETLANMYKDCCLSQFFSHFEP